MLEPAIQVAHLLWCFKLDAFHMYHKTSTKEMYSRHRLSPDIDPHGGDASSELSPANVLSCCCCCCACASCSAPSLAMTETRNKSIFTNSRACLCLHQSTYPSCSATHLLFVPSASHPQLIDPAHVQLLQLPLELIRLSAQQVMFPLLATAPLHTAASSSHSIPPRYQTCQQELNVIPVH